MTPERWQQVKQVLAGALELAPRERGAYLDRSCADSSMRREVVSLIEAHEKGGSGFLNEPDPESDSKGGGPIPASGRGFEPGSTLGPYEILSAVGAGGMGEVYRAKDTRLGRTVAIKILPAHIATDSSRLRRFEREARLASTLNHPNIVTIYELGQSGTTHYIAMEMVEGKTLREMLRAGALPIRKAIEIAAQAAEGLAKAHEAGIAHRDLKPENLMVTADGFVKILDFGLVKRLAEDESALDGQTASVDTRPGSLLGTPGYMSPEQASGQPADFRSDQFSLGLVVYEIVAGRRAFLRNTAAETMAAIVRDAADPVAKHNPDAPAPLCWAVERCLEKEPDKRYVSTRDLARELAAIRDRLGEKPAQAADPRRAASLPVQRTPFVGREKEIAAVRHLLLREDVRLVTVTGPGGIGKTRLAVEAANGLGPHFPGGTHFVALSGLSDPAQLASAIVQALKIREGGGQSPLQMLERSLQDSLRDPLLLLLDNFEHLMEAAPAVAEMLAMGANLKMLVTSRAALHIYGEREFPVPPLALPDTQAKLSVEAVSQSPAVALFTQRATAAKPDFALNSENATAVAEICARLDGLPLAIELAAARVKVLSPSAMRNRLASSLQLLTGGAQDLPARQRTLRAAMDWSHELLGPAEQRLFRRLAAFVGGCTLEGAEAVCDAKTDLGLDVLDGMTSMVDKSLLRQIERPNGESRFAMLETIREYALEKLAASGEEDLTKRALAAYCLVLAEEGAAAHGEVMEAEWLDRFALEHDNFRASIKWLLEKEEADWGLRLGAALFRFWEAREYLAEARMWLDKLLNLPGAAKPSKNRGRALFAAGVLASRQGDYASAKAQFEESLQIARQSKDKHGVAVCLNALALTARERGDLPAARSLCEESLAEWRELGERTNMARGLSNLATVAKLEGACDEALNLYAECVALFRELGDETGLAWTLDSQGDVAREQGETYVARALYEQSLEIFTKLGNRWGVASTLADLGNLAMDERDYPAMRRLYRESLETFRKLDHKRGIARLLESFAFAAAAQARPEQALRLAGAAAALRQHIGAPLTPAEQTKLSARLEEARQTLGNAAGTTAWLEGWTLPAEDAVREALQAGATPRSA